MGKTIKRKTKEGKGWLKENKRREGEERRIWKEMGKIREQGCLGRVAAKQRRTDTQGRELGVDKV